MSTLNQIRANRLNALLSTGPRSAEGKAASRFNALKSGIDAKSQVIEGESADALAALAVEYMQRYQPASPEERALVDILINDEWLLRRFRVVEAKLVQLEINCFRSPDAENYLPLAYANATDRLNRLQRRIDSTERSLHRALAALKKLQSGRPTPAEDPLPAPVGQPQAIEEVQLNTEIGFVPQTAEPVPSACAPGQLPVKSPCADIVSDISSDIS